ncbi:MULTISPECIES: hypothetical protein [unclassified Streptomyces]|uniref:hypothetical protein n=1 Tax=Streptomyces sp. NBRC 14336 TaxID=3030992 RepID=UPI0025578395|nr:hypothetical protein [Streptomyces sp. NBRC 14336]WBO78785.1 hypothetical protein SBE_002418 [Streptomyces sp. SBE_14.2]
MDKSGVESELIDLSGVPLDAWPSHPLPPGDGSMRRLLSRIDDPAGSLGGYNPQRDEA